MIARGRGGHRSGRPYGLVLATAFATTAAAVWMTAAVLTAGRGFDLTDEGLYLLSYRWWDSHHRTFTGAQYVYGPVFAALGYDIAGLRLFRLATVVATHLAFGWSFMRWLRPRRRSAHPSRLWEAAGTSAIVAAGGMVYSWLPPSPSYNDLTLLGSMLAATLVIRAATYVDRGASVPTWLAWAGGPVVVVVVLAKWSAVAGLVLIAVLAAVALAPGGARQLLRLAGWAGLSAALTLAAVHLFVVPLTVVVPQLMAVNGQVAGSHRPLSLLPMYGLTAARTLDSAAGQYWPLLLAAAVAGVAHRGAAARWGVWLVGVPAVGHAIWRALDGGGLGGGAINKGRYVVTLAALLVCLTVTVAFAAVAFTVVGQPSRRACEPSRDSSPGRERAGGWPVLAMLALLPVAYAVGTNTAIAVHAFNALGVWLALVVAAVTGIEAAARPARVLSAGLAAAAIAAGTCIATGGLWVNPYRMSGHAGSTSPAPGVPALASLRLEPRAAAGYAELYGRLRPQLRPPGRAVMAFDKMPGIVLLLDGRSVGEHWYAPADPRRTAAGVAADCPDGRGWWGERAPILLFNRPVSEADLRTLALCGLDLGTGYRLLDPPERTMDIAVYLPIT